MRKVARSMAGAALTLATVAALGCSNDPTGPDDFAGTYDLVRYEGSPIPVIQTQSSAGTVTIVAERILLGDDGKGIKSTTVIEVNAQTPQGAPLAYASGFTYALVGSSIAITFICPPNASCIAGPHLVGERAGSDLILARPASSKPASVYARAR